MLWWGRFDPGYSRNRILRQLLREMGWKVQDFQPTASWLGGLQARLRQIPQPDLVWVPCFRHRDVAAAAGWAKRQGVPLVFDPLISAYDKKVDERRKVKVGSRAAHRLLSWERKLLARADLVVADTEMHADYFSDVLGVPREKIAVLMVGAEEDLFRPCPEMKLQTPIEVLFYGSFIPLQGPEVIVQAAELCKGNNIRWVLLGDGPLRARCEHLAGSLPNVSFEEWLPYEALPARICQAHIVLGIFGDTPKAARVIPNKVYQGLACAKPIVTRASSVYPAELMSGSRTGIAWVPAGNPKALAETVSRLSANSPLLREMERYSASTQNQWFSKQHIADQLQAMILGLLPAAYSG